LLVPSLCLQKLKASRSLAWQTDEDEENVSFKKEDTTATPLKNEIDGESEAGFDSMTVRSPSLLFFLPLSSADLLPFASL